MKPDTCCIFNLAPHYRRPIYTLMDRELQCDFYFGDSVGTPIAEMDVTELRGYKKTLSRKRVSRWNYYWLSGSVRLVFKPYKNYILSGDSKYLSHWFIMFLALLMNKKTFIWSHGMRGHKTGLAKWLNKTYHTLSSYVLLYGEYSKANMLREGFPEKKLKLIYNSLDYEKQLVVREKLQPSRIYLDHFGNNLPVILYIGRIQKIKRLDVLVESLKILEAEGQACNLVIIGKDVDGTNLSSLVSQESLDKQVWLYGPSYNEEEIGNLMYNADLVVSPGPIGLTALHAMTYGVPIITHDQFSLQMPEHEVVLSGATGDFYKIDDVSDLVAKIKAWINLSPEERDRVRKNAYNVIDSKYNPRYQIQLLKELINKS
ncbi:MAG: glycosyltransferase family 4 protein [Bacteroidota bacterium]